MKTSTLVLALVLTATSMLIVTQARADVNLIQNPDFASGLTGWTEVGTFDGQYNFVSTAGGTNPSTPTTALWNGNWSPSAGQPASISGLAGASQTLTTTIGQTYDISLYWLETGANQSGDAQFYEVLWDGIVLGSISDSPGTFPNWQTLSYTVVGTGTDTLTFEGYSNNGYNLTSNVSVVAAESVAVPAPSLDEGVLSWVMMLLGLVGLGFAGHRKSKKSGFTVQA